MVRFQGVFPCIALIALGAFFHSTPGSAQSNCRAAPTLRKTQPAKSTLSNKAAPSAPQKHYVYIVFLCPGMAQKPTIFFAGRVFRIVGAFPKICAKQSAGRIHHVMWSFSAKSWQKKRQKLFLYMTSGSLHGPITHVFCFRQREKAHKHKQNFPVTAWVGGGVSRPRGGGGQKFMCCVRNPRNINVFVRVPGREESGFPAGRIDDRGDREIVYVPNVYVPLPAPIAGCVFLIVGAFRPKVCTKQQISAFAKRGACKRGLRKLDLGLRTPPTSLQLHSRDMEWPWLSLTACIFSQNVKEQERTTELCASCVSHIWAITLIGQVRFAQQPALQNIRNLLSPRRSAVYHYTTTGLPNQTL